PCSSAVFFNCLTASPSIQFLEEAKIQALEQDSQIERYLNILGQQAKSNNIKNNHCKMFFLTPDGRKPVSLNNISTSFSDIDVISISWKDVAVIVNNFSKKCKNEFVSHVSKQYSNFILNHLWR
ncbi:MAG: PD-(D/E)XK nuclease family protein, partial [Desulfamplus sp.]|nr:PD-(D/E)XK nuclease family protein [Desulfamplus sp.]